MFEPRLFDITANVVASSRVRSSFRNGERTRSVFGRGAFLARLVTLLLLFDYGGLAVSGTDRAGSADVRTGIVPDVTLLRSAVLPSGGNRDNGEIQETLTVKMIGDVRKKTKKSGISLAKTPPFFFEDSQQEEETVAPSQFFNTTNQLSGEADFEPEASASNNVPQQTDSRYGFEYSGKQAVTCALYPYRSYTGSCNNLLFPKWGEAVKPYARLLLPAYVDGRGSPRTKSKDGSPLPCARCISLHMAHDQYREYPNYTHMLMQWGQFLNHDLTNKPVWTDQVGNEISCCGPQSRANPECFPIDVPADDPYYKYHGTRCMNFVRSKPYPFRDYLSKFREQYNDNTAFIDGSGIYGSTAKDAGSLRTYRGGRLKSTQVEKYKDLLPTGGQFCRTSVCFKAGDFRANMFPSLSSMHTIWMREHNRIVEKLQQINPLWDDEKLYQEGRKLIGAMLQHITYNEFLVIVLGPGYMNYHQLALQSHGYYPNYDYNVNPTISNAFTTAAFRFGHSLIQPMFKRYHPNHVEIPNSPWLGDEYFNSSCLWNTGQIDQLLLGLVNQHSQITDPFFTAEITNRLYEPGVHGRGQDLVAINVQRGRDNGIPSYNEYRELCGLKRVHNFHDLKGIMNDYSIQVFERNYRSVEDIDLYVAGISEIAIPGGIVGPTFACLIAKQFFVLRSGDRMWYENPPLNGQVGFTLDQLNEIRKVSLARVICENSDSIMTVQEKVMLVASDWNPRIECGNPSLPYMDLSKWQQDLTEIYVSNNDINGDGPSYRKDVRA